MMMMMMTTTTTTVDNNNDDDDDDDFLINFQINSYMYSPFSLCLSVCPASHDVP
jgi:hypothetical protein